MVDPAGILKIERMCAFDGTNGGRRRHCLWRPNPDATSQTFYHPFGNSRVLCGFGLYPSNGGTLAIVKGRAETAPEIRREALLPPNGPKGRPLPLLSHWNGGSFGKGWTAQYQLTLLQQGYRLLPWIPWPDDLKEGGKNSERRFIERYGELLAFCRELRLPICVRGTQWKRSC